MAAKKFNHKRYCASHEKVDGYTAKVCILKGQEPGPIVQFATDMMNLAVRLNRFIRKPGGTPKKPSATVHGGCEGHFDFPGFGTVCYGAKSGWTEKEARAFCIELGH